MNLLNKIKIFLKKFKVPQVETVIISNKQCPHCTSRGLFIFNSSNETNLKNHKLDEKCN